QAHGLRPVELFSLPDFFPPGRYPRGFSAPECFGPGLPRDRRTDLYAWAAVAYAVFTGDRPERLAQEQGQPWARFQQAQFERLEKCLRTIRPAHVSNWGEQLSVDGAALVRAWPANLLTVLRLCLHSDARRRPDSVAELLTWLLTSPSLDDGSSVTEVTLLDEGREGPLPPAGDARREEGPTTC